MENKELLNEERFQKTKKKISFAALIILIIGLSIGGFLIFKGLKGSSPEKMNELTTKLENRRKELESEGIKYDAFTKYTDKEAYELRIITEALDPSFDHCSFDEYKNNIITKDYCVEKNKSDSFNKFLFIGLGVFICFTTFGIAGSVFAFSKQREILSFQAQQIMPVAQEGIEKMAPTVGKAGATVVKEMAPVYGEVAKEISKGIKEGLKEDKK